MGRPQANGPFREFDLGGRTGAQLVAEGLPWLWASVGR